MKKLVYSILSFCLILGLWSFTIDMNKGLLGTWDIRVDDAPVGYNEGSMEFRDDQGVLKGEIVTEKASFQMKNLRVSNDTVTCELAIQSVVLEAVLIKKQDSISGKILTPEGDLNLSGVRKIAK